jgi:hypothetical protein
MGTAATLGRVNYVSEFWEIIGTSPVRTSADIEISLQRIGDCLEVLSPAEVSQFDKDLRESLYHLDRREFGQIRVRTTAGMEFPQTSDHFLYARCACVMAGVEVYESVLKTRSGFERFVPVFAQGAESLLYLAPEIYKNKVGEGLQIAGSFPIESMSNVEGWN